MGNPELQLTVVSPAFNVTRLLFLLLWVYKTEGEKSVLASVDG